jgi:hypothetical protein
MLSECDEIMFMVFGKLDDKKFVAKHLCDL